MPFLMRPQSRGISSGSLALLHSLIYSFHMPLFFLISGYFLNTLSAARSRKEQIWKKFQRLMVPYVFVGLAYAPCKLLLSQFANDPFRLSNLWKMVIGVNPDGELWFLYSLFVISVFAIATRARVGNKWIICSIISGGITNNSSAARQCAILPVFLFPGALHPAEP